MAISRQRRWQLQRMAEGKCATCGKRRDCKDKTRCTACKDGFNKYRRERRARGQEAS